MRHAAEDIRDEGFVDPTGCVRLIRELIDTYALNTCTQGLFDSVVQLGGLIYLGGEQPRD
jgi:hypothetical protein